MGQHLNSGLVRRDVALLESQKRPEELWAGWAHIGLELSNEERRLVLVSKIKCSKEKINILNIALTSVEQTELQELTRNKYLSMPCMRVALGRLHLAFDEIFSEEDSSKLKLLTNHVIGYYLNTNQYHNAFHAISMTLESLNICNILGVTDIKALKAVVIGDLYHDSGNGEAPTAPDSAWGDEVQSCKIFKTDLKSVEAKMIAGLDLGPLAALADLERERIQYPLPIHVQLSTRAEQVGNIETSSMAEVVTACIAYTVFKDRFETLENLAFHTQYIKIILEQFHETEEISVEQYKHFLNLSQSYIVWIAKNADIAGSLEGIHGVQNSLLSYAEDQMRAGFKPGHNQDFDQYRAGFLGFIGAAFASPTSTMAKEIKEQGFCPFPSIGKDDQEAYYSSDGLVSLRKFFEERVQQEDRYFSRAKEIFGKMLTALFVIAAEESQDGKNVAHLTIAQLRIKLEKWQNAEISRVKAILPESNIENWGPRFKRLDYDLERFPLLKLDEFQGLTIADLSPAIFNRIFLPEIAEARTLGEAQKIDQLRKANEISKLTNPRNIYFLDTYFGELNERQIDLIINHDQIEIAPSQSHNAQQKIMIEAWTKFRQEFQYHEIIQLAEAGIIDHRIAGSSQEACCIQNTIFDLAREEEQSLMRPCLTGILNLLAHCPRSFRILSLDSQSELIKFGKKTGAVYILLEGDLSINIRNKIIPLQRGELVGEMSVLSDLPAIASVYVPAGKSAQVAMVRKEDILAQYAAAEFRTHLISLARARRGLRKFDQN